MHRTVLSKRLIIMQCMILNDWIVKVGHYKGLVNLFLGTWMKKCLMSSCGESETRHTTIHTVHCLSDTHAVAS